MPDSVWQIHHRGPSERVLAVVRKTLMRGGEMSRIRFDHEIWRPMPEAWYTNFASEVVRLNL